MSDDELSSGDESEGHEKQVDKRWRASEPPKEVFTESETTQDWAYDIIGEEVDENGRVMLEVRWDDWARKDGTKTTWNSPTSSDDSDGGSIDGDRWKNAQRKIRLATAKDSLEIDFISTNDIHNMETYLKNQAYKEKLALAEAMPRTNLLSELLKVQAKHQEQPEAESSDMVVENQGSSMLSYPKRSNQRASTRQKSELSLANSVRGTTTTTRSSSWMSSVASASTSSSSLKSTPRSTTLASSSSLPTSKSSSVRLSSSSENLRLHKRPRLSDTHSHAAQCSKLEKEWTTIAAQHKAAPISFVNTVDAEPVPPLPPGFLYLEARYKFSSDVTRPAHMEDFLVKCSSQYCVDIAGCECQAASTLVDDTGNPMLAYTPNGYFAFNVPKGTEVVECNKLCGCSLKNCRNRVSQRPRDIPIEVFKTESRGWGVRPLVDVRRGKVLGLYTGLVIPRETAHSMSEPSNSEYVFDLDGDEDDEDDSLHHQLFSVDSKLCGNWTRFINHSCSPNIQIYLVVHDIPPANGLPFIAFVAQTNISARTEFTLDYDPRAAERMKKGKKMKAVPEGAKTCFCGAEVCRGVISSS